MCEICRERRRIVEETRWYQWVWEIIKLLAAITILIFGAAWLCHAVGMVGTEAYVLSFNFACIYALCFLWADSSVG